MLATARKRCDANAKISCRSATRISELMECVCFAIRSQHDGIVGTAPRLGDAAHSDASLGMAAKAASRNRYSSYESLEWRIVRFRAPKRGALAFLRVKQAQWALADGLDCAAPPVPLTPIVSHDSPNRPIQALRATGMVRQRGLGKLLWTDFFPISFCDWTPRGGCPFRRRFAAFWRARGRRRSSAIRRSTGLRWKRAAAA